MGGGASCRGATMLKRLRDTSQPAWLMVDGTTGQRALLVAS